MGFELTTVVAIGTNCKGSYERLLTLFSSLDYLPLTTVSNQSTIGIHDEGHSRKAPCVLNWMYTFLLTKLKYILLIHKRMYNTICQPHYSLQMSIPSHAWHLNKSTNCKLEIKSKKDNRCTFFFYFAQNFFVNVYINYTVEIHTICNRLISGGILLFYLMFIRVIKKEGWINAIQYCSPNSIHFLVDIFTIADD